jgi:hypothetical protein
VTGAKTGAGLLLLSIMVLAGCAGPMSQREAVQLAREGLHAFCDGRADCNASRVMHAQKIKDRWLIEFDAAANTYGVAVHSDGNTDISVWDKPSPAAR